VSIPRHGRAAALVLLALTLGVTVAACGSGSGGGGAAGARTVEVALTDAGCEPAKLDLPAGAVTFEVTNKGTSKVSELEVKKADRILGEVENVTAGLKRSFSLDLEPGTYELECPGGVGAATGTLTVAAGGDAGGQASAEAAEVAASAERYRGYVRQQTVLLVARTRELADAVIAGDVAAAKRRYGPARVPYERIEPVAESFGDLDPAIDAREGDVPAAQWGGFHRIEQALWARSTTSGMQPVARKLLGDVTRLQQLVGTVALDAAQIANGANELLGAALRCGRPGARPLPAGSGLCLLPAPERRGQARALPVDRRPRRAPVPGQRQAGGSLRRPGSGW
jgi:iron uptake system component EfeO